MRERRREELVRTLVGLPQRRILESIEVTSPDGEVVFELQLQLQRGGPGGARVPPRGARGPLRRRRAGDRDQLPHHGPGRRGRRGGGQREQGAAGRAGRPDRRRSSCTRPSCVAGVTLLTLVAAFSFVWHLIQRTRRLEEQRREAAEMAALGVLAANLAHEIRNPLNSINLNLELLEEDLAGGQRGRGRLPRQHPPGGGSAGAPGQRLPDLRPAGGAALEPVRVMALLSRRAPSSCAGRRGARASTCGCGRTRPTSRCAGTRPAAPGPAQPGAQRGPGGVPACEPDRRLVELGAEVGDGVVRLASATAATGIPSRGAGAGAPPLRLAAPRRHRPRPRHRRADRPVATAGDLELDNLEVGLRGAVVLPVAPRDGKMSEGSARRRPRRLEEWQAVGLTGGDGGTDDVRSCGEQWCSPCCWRLRCRRWRPFSAADLLYLPVAAHNEGVEGSLWRTDLTITNVDEVADRRLHLLLADRAVQQRRLPGPQLRSRRARGASGGATSTRRWRTSRRRGTVVLEDVVGGTGSTS